MSAVDPAPRIGDAVVLGRTDHLDRADWLDQRRGGIGGSDVAGICGLSNYDTPFTVWLDKTAAPNLPDDEMSEAAEWGLILEPVVRQQTAKRAGLIIDPLPFLLASRTEPFMIANVDGIASRPHATLDTLDTGVYEGKTAGVWAGDGWEDNGVPDAYLLQGMHYLAVTGLDWLIFGVLIGGQRLEVRRVARDEELIDHLVTIETAFWQRVVDRIPPEPDGGKVTTGILAHLYDVRPDSVVSVDDPEDVRALLVDRQDIKAQGKALDERATEIENRLKVLIGEHEIAVDPDGRPLFTWKQHEVNRIDTKALRSDRPDVADAFTKTTNERRFWVPKGSLT